MPEPSPARIDRAFLRIAAGQVHYRTASPATPSGRPPLYMAHAGPGSSLGLAPLIAALGASRRVIAPDMIGNGDSDPPAEPPESLRFHADCVVQILDGLEIDRVDYYGSHTGAQIGLELAIAHPDRVRRIVLDGLPLFPPALKTLLLERYAPAVEPDDHGGHLAWAWTFVRDQSWHFPYFLRDPEHRLSGGAVPSARAVNTTVVEVLKALGTYQFAYRAAFRQDVAALLPRIAAPTLVMAVRNDPLAVYLPEVAVLLPGCEEALVDRDARAERIAAFVDA